MRCAPAWAGAVLLARADDQDLGPIAGSHDPFEDMELAMDVGRQDTRGIGVGGGRIAPAGEMIHRIGLHFPHRRDNHRPLSDVGGQEAHRGRQRRADGRRLAAGPAPKTSFRASWRQYAARCRPTKPRTPVIRIRIVAGCRSQPRPLPGVGGRVRTRVWAIIAAAPGATQAGRGPRNNPGTTIPALHNPPGIRGRSGSDHRAVKAPDGAPRSR